MGGKHLSAFPVLDPVNDKPLTYREKVDAFNLKQNNTGGNLRVTFSAACILNVGVDPKKNSVIVEWKSELFLQTNTFQQTSFCSIRNIREVFKSLEETMQDSQKQQGSWESFKKDLTGRKSFFCWIALYQTVKQNSSNSELGEVEILDECIGGVYAPYTDQWIY